MRIAALERFIAHLVCAFGQADKLVAVPVGFTVPELEQQPTIVTEQIDSNKDDLIVGLASTPVNSDLLAQSRPDLVFTSVPGKQKEQAITVSSDWNQQLDLPAECKVVSYNPVNLTQIYEVMENLGGYLKISSEARSYAQRIKAQLMNWSDSFQDRCRRKKVVFLAKLEPLTVAGEWLADMIHLTGAQSYIAPGLPTKSCAWEDIVAYRPDVIMIAPHGADQDQAYSSFKILEKLSGWDELPAVKRGEVYFSAGDRLFYEPGVEMIDSMAFIVSAIAGFESGYITKRDSYQRLRWLELQRHRFQ